MEHNSYLEELWKSISEYIKEKIGHDAFRDWFSKAYIEYDNGYCLKLPNEFAKNWVSKNYTHYINSLSEELGIELKIGIGNLNNKTILNEEENTNKFDERFSFENFVVDKSNEIAYEAALQLAKSNEIIFNPLFIYGNVGLGKTHLMNAIANYRIKFFPKQKVMYLSAEQFMHAFVKSVQDRTVTNFKEEFRSVDLLMIDDFQFLDKNKGGTQEAFFHTFNALVEQKKQLIISADQPPSALPGVEERLKSRLGWGLIVDIHPATYELKIGILKNKAKKLNLTIENEVFDFIATKITTSIRELEGAFTRIIKYSEWLNQPINLELANKMLQGIAQTNICTPEQTLEKICEILDIESKELKSNARNRGIVRARQKIVYIMRNKLHLSYMQIAKLLGNKDHSSIIYAENQAKKFKDEDLAFAQDLLKIEQAI